MTERRERLGRERRGWEEGEGVERDGETERETD